MNKTWSRHFGIPDSPPLPELPAWLSGPRSEAELRATISAATGSTLPCRLVDRGLALLADGPKDDSPSSAVAPSAPGAAFVLGATGRWLTIWPQAPKKRKR